MKDILKNIDPKTITSAGGIIIAIFLAYFLWDISANKIGGLERAFASFSDNDIKSKANLAEALLQNAKAIEGNTKVMEQIIRSNR